MSRHVNLINLGNVLQRNFGTSRDKECISRPSRGKNFKKFTARCHLVAPSWVKCIYRSAQKHSGYATDNTTT